MILIKQSILMVVGIAGAAALTSMMPAAAVSDVYSTDPTVMNGSFAVAVSTEVLGLKEAARRLGLAAYRKPYLCDRDFSLDKSCLPALAAPLDRNCVNKNGCGQVYIGQAVLRDPKILARATSALWKPCKSLQTDDRLAVQSGVYGRLDCDSGAVQVIALKFSGDTVLVKYKWP